MNRHIAQLALGVGLLAFVSMTTGCHQERNESIRLMNAGLAKFKREKPFQAMDLLGRAGEVDPTNHRAFYYQGLIQSQKLGNLPKAEEFLRKAIAVTDKNYEYHYHLGSVLLDNKDPRSAIGALKSAIALRGSHAESHLRLGMALEETGEIDKAQESYRESIRQNPRFPEAYNALGNLYLQYEHPSHAAHVFKNGIENNPSWARNYHDLGLVYQGQKRLEAAISNFEKSLGLDPANVGAAFNLGMAHADRGAKRDALRYLNAYLVNRGGTEDPLRVQAAQEMIHRLEAEKGR
jgi:tetratricopeptide (TPR) repeat protein